MTNTKKLKQAISEKGLKLEWIACKMGLHPNSISKKINNTTEFKASEIVALSELLGFTESERDDIFFSLCADE